MDKQTEITIDTITDAWQTYMKITGVVPMVCIAGNPVTGSLALFAAHGIDKKTIMLALNSILSTLQSNEEQTEARFFVTNIKQ
jgi:hypothetical protein